MSFAWDVGVREVIFECDSQIVAETVNESCDPPVAIRNIVEGIQHKLKEFRVVQVSHVLCGKRK